jgi:hypothetical protein
MWTALTTLFLVAGSIWFYNAPLERQANPLVTPLHVVAPWYLAWSQGWLKLADKVFIAFIFIPGLATAFFVMPYIEVGKSRRYADRRVGLTVAMVFIAFMWLSNWMGSPEYRVQSSPDQEVSQELLPQEGHSTLKEVPYEELEPGVYRPGDEVPGNRHLNAALHEFEEAMMRRSCALPGTDEPWPTCRVSGSGEEARYGNGFTDDAMPNPDAWLTIDDYQHNMRRLVLTFEVVDPNNPDSLLYEYSRTAYRHELSNYEEE